MIILSLYPTPELSRDSVKNNFEYEPDQRDKPKNEPEPVIVPRIEPGIEPKPEPGLYLLSSEGHRLQSTVMSEGYKSEEYN